MTLASRPAPPAERALPSRRGALGLAGIGALGLALSGCVADHRIGSGTAVVVAEPVADGIGALEEPTGDAAHGLELPGIRYRVARCGTVPSLPAADAMRLGLPAPPDAEAEEWAAPQGEILLIAQVAAEVPLVMEEERPVGIEYSEHVMIGDQEVPTVLGPLRRSDEQFMGGVVSVKTVVASVPEGIAAEDACFEVRAGGIVQRLSLLDGSRIHSDLERWYTSRFAAEVEKVFWQREDERFGTAPVLAGYLLDATIAPMLPDGTFAAADHLMLGLEAEVLETPDGVREISELILELPDGTAVAAHGDASATFTPRTEEIAWFEVPVDTAEVIAQVHLRIEHEGEQVDLGVEPVTVTLKEEER